MKQINLPVIGRVDSKSLLSGMGIAFGLLVLPKVSEPIINFIVGIRDKIGGNN